jgi:hypothetical protein
MTPNKHMQRSVRDKVLGRGRIGVVLEQVCGARVLKGCAAGADVNRYATRAHFWRSQELCIERALCFPRSNPVRSLGS